MRVTLAEVADFMSQASKQLQGRERIMLGMNPPIAPAQPDDNSHQELKLSSNRRITPGLLSPGPAEELIAQSREGCENIRFLLGWGSITC